MSIHRNVQKWTQCFEYEDSHILSLSSFPPIQSSEDEDFGASVADDDDEDEDAGSDIGSVDSRAHSRRTTHFKGACKRKPIRTQRKARKWQRGRRRCSSEEEEDDSEEEMGKCLRAGLWAELMMDVSLGLAFSSLSPRRLVQ